MVKMVTGLSAQVNFMKIHDFFSWVFLTIVWFLVCVTIYGEWHTYQMNKECRADGGTLIKEYGYNQYICTILPIDRG